MAIFEQMVRERSGGLMSDAIYSGDFETAHLKDLFGDMLTPLAHKARERPAVSPHGSTIPVISGWRRLSAEAGGAARRLRCVFERIQRSPTPTPLDLRLTKEAVRWMYDRLSLKLLLEAAGFDNVAPANHRSSRIANWAAYNFDQSAHGDYPLDPSVYVEGRRPIP
jgi:hypothetical protein